MTRGNTSASCVFEEKLVVKDSLGLSIHSQHLISESSCQFFMWCHSSLTNTDMVFMCPSIFCIGMTGKLLVVMNGPQSSAQLQYKLTEAFKVSREFLDKLTGF